ncbi:MAG: hypothetical protein K9G46_07105 [Flavobacteriales bacterium]|nr:hypothetical protein [Flavobacteriales bacterium]
MATEKKGIKKYAGLIAGLLSFIGLGFLGYILYRRMQFRFANTHDSRYLGDQYDWWKGLSISSKYNGLNAEGKTLLQLNSASLFKVGDKVKVTFDDARGGTSTETEVLEVPSRKLILIDQYPNSGGPWSGTVQLA